MTREWTPEQKNAIFCRGGGLLVSAAAGSGKTAVLVERVISRVLDDDPPVDIDRLLVVTFSKASASEMRRRIGQSIRQRLKETPHDQHLLRQQMLLDSAHISTIHSFCYDLIRQNFAQLGLPHDLRLADEKEIALLRRRALQDVLARRYAAENSSAFFDLVELVSASRNDQEMEKLVERLYDFLRSHPFYEDWLEEKRRLYDPNVAVNQSEWGRIILNYAAEGLAYARTLLESAIERMDDAMADVYAETFKLDLQGVCHLQQLAEQGEWDDLRRALREMTFGRLKALRGYTDDGRKAYVLNCREEVRGLIKDLSGRRFCASADQHAEDMEFLAPRVGALFDTVLELDREFAKVKQERHILDFSDLEHMALTLLVRREEGKPIKTELAQQLSEQMEEILVDEYQDTNGVQEMLFVTLSRNEKNLFFVGDVKQSIYRFRQAMPELFIQRKTACYPYDGGHFPACVTLDKNFRSRSNVTDTVNYLFGMLMSPKVGEIEYNEKEALVCGAVFPDDEEQKCMTELHLVDTSGSDVSARQLEAEYTAGYIRRLLDSGMTVGSEENLHPIGPGDICILLRSTKGRAGNYAAALAQQGVPCWANIDSGFLESEEISSVLALLQAVDNPLLDLTLTQALASPIFAMDADDLARIRGKARGTSMYQAVKAAAADGDRACGNFLDVLEDLRRHAAWESASRVIQRLYDRTNFLRIARVMPDGRLRRNNLRLLVDYALDCENRGSRGISGFLNFVNQLKRQGEDLAPAAAPASGAVAVSSIHSSKGLEYPVVILADLDKKFNRNDLSKNNQVHSRLGFACKRRDHKRMIQFSTVPLEAVRIETEREQLSEEMRVLYVALTRAKEKLVLIAASDKPEKALAPLDVPLENGVLPAWAVRNARCYFDWVAAAILHHPDGLLLRQAAGLNPVASDRKGGLFRICLGEAAYCTQQKAKEAFCLAEADPVLVEQMECAASYRYPFENETITPSKFAVSQLAHQQSDEMFCAARPAFLDEDGLTAAQKGSATHKFMQYADYTAAMNSPESELVRLTEQGYLSRAEADAVDQKAVETFFASDIARRMRLAGKVLRELHFMGELTAAELEPYTQMVKGSEPVVLQGIADCVLMEQDGAVVIDYKTDRVKTADVLVQRYRGQLELYARLLRDTLECPVKECWLYSFALGQAIRVC